MTTTTEGGPEGIRKNDETGNVKGSSMNVEQPHRSNIRTHGMVVTPRTRGLLAVANGRVLQFRRMKLA